MNRITFWLDNHSRLTYVLKQIYALLVCAGAIIGTHFGVMKTNIGDILFSILIFMALIFGAAFEYKNSIFRLKRFWFSLATMGCLIALRLFLNFIVLFPALAVSAIVIIRWPYLSSVDVTKQKMLISESNFYYFLNYVREKDDKCNASCCKNLWSKLPLEKQINWVNETDEEKERLVCDAKIDLP